MAAVHTILVPDRTAALQRSRSLAASCDSGLFGAGVFAVTDWLADRWELLGTGERPVKSDMRRLLARRALAETEGLELTPGTVGLVEKLARDALPLFEDGSAGELADLSEAEQALGAVMRRYAVLFDGFGLIEYSQIIKRLVDDPEFSAHAPRPGELLFAGFGEMPPFYRVLADRLGAECEVPGDELPWIDPDRLRFLLPAGDSATDRLILEALLSEELPAAVAVADPVRRFEHMRDALLRQGVSVGLQARIPFFDTPFGRGYRALLSFFDCDDGRWREAMLWAMDFLESPLSDVSAPRVRGLKSQWLRDRTLTLSDIYQDLCDESAFFVEFRPGVITESLERRFPAHAAAIEHAMETIHGMDAPVSELSSLLEMACVVVSQVSEPADATGHAADDACGEGGAEGRPASPRTVTFMTLDEAAKLVPRSVETLVIGDLSASVYPIRLPETAATLLLGKLGVPDERDPLAQARRRFASACAAARGRIYLERSLNDADGNPDYPAAVLEDLLEQYHANAGDAGADGGADGEGVQKGASPKLILGGLPACFSTSYTTRGESDLQENASLAARGSCDVRVRHALSFVRNENRRLVVLPRSGAEAQAPAIDHAAGVFTAPPLVLSASAIESYLDCPGKWFAERRLSLDEDVAGFGPLEKGSFSHGVLESFFRSFVGAGYARVETGNIAEAIRLLDDVFDRHVELQAYLKPHENPLVATTALEEQELEALRRNLHALIVRNALFLPRFRPAHFEYSFGTGESVSYAGALLRGSIDRIDVDDRGRAVIIDYKGSAGPQYELASTSAVLTRIDGEACEIELPQKIQALVYAQVARRLLGVDIAGALYLSYGRKGDVAGAYDATVLGPAEIPGIREDKCAAPADRAFSDLLDEVEERIALVLARLAEGRIDPSPRDAKVCDYCPVLSCDVRRGV